MSEMWSSGLAWQVILSVQIWVMEEGRYCLWTRNIYQEHKIWFRSFTGLQPILSASLTFVDSNNYVAMDCSHHHFYVRWHIKLIESIYRCQTRIIHVMACHGWKGANYLSICLYVKGNLTQHYNKPLSSHGFSAIL